MMFLFKVERKIEFDSFVRLRLIPTINENVDFNKPITSLQEMFIDIDKESITSLQEMFIDIDKESINDYVVGDNYVLKIIREDELNV